MIIAQPIAPLSDMPSQCVHASHHRNEAVKLRVLERYLRRNSRPRRVPKVVSSP